MSKITVPLLMIFAAIGFIALAKLDHDEKADRERRWPAKSPPPVSEPAMEPEESKRIPIELAESLSGEEFERLTNRELANIRLLPIAEDAYPVSFLWPTDGNDAPAHPELLEFARCNSFDNWKSYTDEHLGFYYPDAPGIRVEVIDIADPVPLIGELMLPAEKSTFRKYRISAGDTGTLCVISLSREPRFDDTERAPYPEIFHRFTPSGGGLMRTSLTESGQVRRVELIGRDIRVSLLDWPHLAVHEDVYLRIACGIKLAEPYAKLGDLRRAAQAEYGLEGKLGHLDQGVSVSEIISTVGQPVAREEGQESTLEYFDSRDSELHFYRLEIHNGLFAGFGPEWHKVTTSAPGGGLLRWMVEKTAYHAGEAGGIGYNLGPLTDDEVQMIFDRFVELAPTAGANDWPGLCQVVANLAQHGLHDPRVLEIVRAKLESPDLDPKPALLALEACNSDLAKAAIAEHIITTLATPAPDPETLEHAYTLIAYLGKKHPASAQLIDRALGHESNRVRELGFKFCSWLPEKFSIPHLEAGLQDESTEVRRYCANAFAIDHGDPARHLPILETCLAEENDEQVKRLLQQALQRLGEAGG